jgi:hypothetical protein
MPIKGDAIRVECANADGVCAFVELSELDRAPPFEWRNSAIDRGGTLAGVVALPPVRAGACPWLVNGRADAGGGCACRPSPNMIRNRLGRLLHRSAPAKNLPEAEGAHDSVATIARPPMAPIGAALSLVVTTQKETAKCVDRPLAMHFYG